MGLAQSVVLAHDDAIVLLGLTGAPGLGPVVVLPIGRFPVHDGVNTLLADVLWVFAHHRDKRAARFALVFGDLKCLRQVGCCLAPNLVVGVGPVDFEHGVLYGE
jgi:hypothetical protein